MKRWWRTFTLVIFTLIAQASLRAQNTLDKGPDGYRIAGRMSLVDTMNGVQGELQILEDFRITPELQKTLWQTGQLDGVPDDSLASFKNLAAKNAVLRVVRRDGFVLESKTLERPLATLTQDRLYAGTTVTYLVTVDYTAGFGSYSGPTTSLVEIHGAHMDWVKAIDPKTGKQQELTLTQSPKTAWKFTPSRAGGKQILLAACRPDFAAKDEGFKTTYTRFYFDGSHWVDLHRSVKGLNEFEGGFPSRTNFP